MPRMLVFGASGQIGRYLVPHLLDGGHEVLAVSRSERAATRPGLRWINADLFAQVPELPGVDAILSLGPLDGCAQWLSRTQVQGQPRIVAFSSMSVASKRESEDPFERALAQSLQAGEDRLIHAAGQKSMGWTLLRPTLIYGAGMDRSLTPLARFGARTRLFPRLDFASGLRQPVHAEDLARICLVAAQSEAARDRRFDLGGGERLPFAQMLERTRRSLGKPVLGVPVPAGWAGLALRVARLLPRWRAIHAGALTRLQDDLLADDRAARALLGWSARQFKPDASTWRSLPDI